MLILEAQFKPTIIDLVVLINNLLLMFTEFVILRWIDGYRSQPIEPEKPNPISDKESKSKRDEDADVVEITEQ